MVDNIHEYQRIDQFLEGTELTAATWKAPGPMSLAYVKSDNIIRGMIGPNGCGKTTTMEMGEVFCAIRAPMCRDGVRRYRTLFLRDTLRQLYRTTISTWNSIFPQTAGQWSGGQDRPAEHKLKLVDDYGPIELEALFSAIPDTSIRDWYDGFEPTSICANGVNAMPEDVFTFGLGRIGRFPKKALLVPGFDNEKHFGFDMNKADVDHWCYETFINRMDPAFMTILDFPGGMDPNAENRENLPSNYYEDMIRVNAARQWYIDIFVHNKWGASRSGTAVYPDYDDRRHLAREDRVADPGLELCLGLDAGTVVGGRPSAVFFQVGADARVIVLDELYLGRSGPTPFFEALLARLDMPHLRPASSRLRAWCDPSAFYGADKESGEMTWVDKGEMALGITIEEPESNELEGFRLETVRVLLNKRTEGVEAFSIDPRCKRLRGGFNSGYRYKRTIMASGVKEDPKPEKNDWSHPHDALQHGLTGYFGRSLVIESGRARSARHEAGGAGAPRPFTLDFDPFA